MSLLNYTVFMEVYNNQSFAKAAENLHMSPSAVSHAVAKLEEEMGFPLLVRRRREIILTDSGEALYPVIRSIVSGQELLDEKADQIRGLTSGRVRIGAMSSIFMSWLPDILERFTELYPDVRIFAKQIGYNNLREHVMDGALDIAFISRSAAVDLDTSFEFTHLYNDPIILVAPEDLKITKNKYVSGADMEKLNIIEYATGEDPDLQPLFSGSMKAGAPAAGRNSNFSATDDSTILSLVRGGFGCAIIPELCTRGHITDGLKSYLLKDEVYRDIGIMTRSEKQQSPATRQFVKIIREYVDGL